MRDAGGRPPGVLLLLGVLAIAALAWFLLQPPEVVERTFPPADGAPGEDPASGADLDAAPLAGRGNGADEPAPALAPPPAVGDIHNPTHVVRGIVTQSGGGPLPAVEVTVHVLRAYGWVDSDIPPASITNEDDGRYTLDVSSFLAGEKPPTQLQVAFDHPKHVAVRRKLVTGAARRVQPRGPLVLEADAVLDPAIVVEGVVHDLQAEPLAGIKLYLLVPSDKGFQLNEIAEPVVLDEAETNAAGAFALRAPKPGRYYVAALSKLHLPEGEAIEVDWQEQPAAVELALSEGLSITGRVTLDGAPLAKVHVEAIRRPQPEPEFRLDFHAIYLRNGRLQPGERTADTDETGRFEIHGLAEGTRRVAPTWIDGTQAWPKLLHAVGRDIQPGSHDVVFDVAGVLVEVRPVSLDALVEDADVAVSRKPDMEVQGRTSREHPTHFILPPETTLWLQVKHPAFEPVVRELRTGLPGADMTETVDLGTPKPQGTLVLTLTDEAGKPVKRADIQIVDPKAEISFGFDMVEAKQSADGVYRLEHLDPGPRVVVVRPGRSSMEFIGHFLVVRENVLLSANKETRHSIVAKQGGRLRVSVRDEQGNLLDCNATLRSARGEPLQVMYVTGGESFAQMTSRGPGSASPTMVEPPLESGEYELEVSSPGHETKRVTAKAKAGETTDVEVTLRKL